MYLMQHRLVRSRKDFCQTWLGVNDSYLRTLKFRNRQVGVRPLAHCASQLRLIGKALTAGEASSFTPIGQELLRLSQRCLDEVVARCR